MSEYLNVKECLGDSYDNVELRKFFFEQYGYNNDALVDSASSIRLAAYNALGFTPNAFNDESPAVRTAAYRKLGFNPDAFNDSHDQIRLEAYEQLGYTDEACNDSYSPISYNARVAKIKRNAKLIVSNYKDNTDFIFVIKVKDDDKYIAQKQDEWEWGYTRKLHKARNYKTIRGAMDTGMQARHDLDFEIVPLIVSKSWKIA